MDSGARMKIGTDPIVWGKLWGLHIDAESGLPFLALTQENDEEVCMVIVGITNEALELAVQKCEQIYAKKITPANVSRVSHQVSPAEGTSLLDGGGASG